MTRPFTFPGLTTRVVFGHGTLAQVPDEVARLGHSRALVLSTPHQQAEAQALADRLGDKAAGIASIGKKKGGTAAPPLGPGPGRRVRRACACRAPRCGRAPTIRCGSSGTRARCGARRTSPASRA